MPTPLPPKKEVMLALLERSSVFVHLDPRRDDVRVPPWFKKQAQLVLQVGLNMAVPIPDLSVDDDSVSCTLSFSRSPHFCYVPWSAVFALVGDDSRGMVWPNDIPPEVAAQGEKRKRDVGKARLQAVPNEPAAAAKDAGGPPAIGAAAASPRKGRRRAGKKRRALAAVPEPSADSPDEAASQASAGDSPREIASPVARPKTESGEAASAPPAAPRADETAPAEAGRDSSASSDSSAERKSKRPPYLRVVK